MRRITLCAALALAMFASLPACAAADAVLADGFDRAPNAFARTEFVVMQNFSVESVTCSSWFSHADFQDYGSVTGSGCTTTGPLLADGGGDVGHVSVSFTFTDGTTINLAACRVDSTVLSPGGYDHQTIECTHG